jgi:phosphate transport system permease protein
MEKNLKKQKVFETKNKIFFYLTASAAYFIPILIFAILISLSLESSDAIKKFGLIKFITTSNWNPVKDVFGGAASIYGTLVTTALSLLIAAPIAIGIAIFITQICPKKLKGAFAQAIELLASIPSIIYGMWGLFTLSPIMADYIEPFLKQYLGGVPLLGIIFSGTPIGIDLLTASFILSIMIIPFITSVARDSFELVPKKLEEAAYGIGATKWEVIKDVILPYSKAGLFGGIVLGLGRAIGETMAVAFVLGNKHEIVLSLFGASSTIPVTLANEFTEADSNLYLSSLFYLALILFISSFAILALAKILVLRNTKK